MSLLSLVSLCVLVCVYMYVLFNFQICVSVDVSLCFTMCVTMCHYVCHYLSLYVSLTELSLGAEQELGFLDSHLVVSLVAVCELELPDWESGFVDEESSFVGETFTVAETSFWAGAD